jgi:hypothetical protein
MSMKRSLMIEALNELVLPVLVARGFEGSFPSFRRPGKAVVQLLSFHFDEGERGFAALIATCPPQGITTSEGKQIPAAKLTAADVSPHFHLGAADATSPHWYNFDNKGVLSYGDPYRRAARDFLACLDSQADRGWAPPHPRPQNRKATPAARRRRAR